MLVWESSDICFPGLAEDQTYRAPPHLSLLSARLVSHKENCENESGFQLS